MSNLAAQSMATRFSLYAKRLEGMIAQDLSIEVDIVQSCEPFGLLNVYVPDASQAKNVATLFTRLAPSLRLVKTFEYTKSDDEETDSITLVLGLKGETA